MVGDEELYDLGPGLIQCLIPDAGGKVLLYFNFLSFCHFLNLPLLLLYLFLPLLEWNLVDLVDQNEDIGVLIVLLDTAEGELPILKALLQSLSVVFNLEDVDQHFYSSEDRLFLH